MPTITYDYQGVCAGGGHVTFDITLNGQGTRRVPFTVDELRQPLSALSRDEQDALALMILRLHFAGVTRAAMKAEGLAGPITVTI